MSASAPVPADHPLMKAWEAYKASDEYASTKKWAVYAENTDGSLWAAYSQGWRDGGGQKPFTDDARVNHFRGLLGEALQALQNGPMSQRVYNTPKLIDVIRRALVDDGLNERSRTESDYHREQAEHFHARTTILHTALEEILQEAEFCRPDDAGPATTRIAERARKALSNAKEG
jgi:hypothetical protein